MSKIIEKIIYIISCGYEEYIDFESNNLSNHLDQILMVIMDDMLDDVFGNQIK